MTTTKEQKKLIKSTWDKAKHVLNNSWSHYGDKLYKQCLEETKEHDRFRGERIKRGLTITEEAQLFSIQTLCKYVFIANNTLDAAEYNHMKTSHFIAYSCAKDFNKDLKAALDIGDALSIIELDYCELIKAD